MSAPPSGVLFYEARAKPLSTIGLIQPGSYYQFYLTQTLTPANVYADGNLVTPLSQTPGTGGTTAASDGRLVPIYLNPATTYRYQLYSVLNQLLEDVDPYIPAPLPTQAQLGPVLYPQTAGEVAVSVTPTNFIYPPGNVLRYGADPLGSADSALAFLNAQKVATQSSIELFIPGGTYKSTTSLSWGFEALQVRASGKVVINFTNTGPCITIDGGASDPRGITGVRVQGYIKVVGNVNTTDAWFLRACHHGDLTMRAGDCTTGLHTQWVVANKINFICSSNEGIAGFAILVPSVGMLLDRRGLGETTAGNTFITPILEGITGGSGVGIVLSHTLMNSFYGGTSEGNKLGIQVLAQTPQDNADNTFVGMDFESNITTGDILVQGGTGLTCIGINSSSLTGANNIDLQGGINTTFVGGFLRLVSVGASSGGTSFNGCALATGGGVGIVGTGVYRSVGCTRVDGTGAAITAYAQDVVGNTLTQNPLPTISGATTPGTQTYNTQLGTYTQVGTTGNGFVDFAIVLTLATNAGGGTGIAIVTLPVAARNITGLLQTVVIGDYTGVTLGANGRTLAMRLSPGLATGLLLETDSGSVSNFIPITSVASTASIVISGRYLI